MKKILLFALVIAIAVAFATAQAPATLSSAAVGSRYSNAPAQSMAGWIRPPSITPNVGWNT